MAELALSVVAHALLGVAAALVVWALGLGWLRALPLPRPAFAYPLGLLAAVAAAWLVLVSPWLAPVSLLLLAPAVLGLRGAAVAAAPVLPFAAAFGVGLGALLHGPTSDVDSHAYGDMLVYAARLVAATQSVLPFRDLLVEGASSTYAESGSTFLGAALAWIPGFDPILFQAAAMPAFLVTAAGAGFRLAQIGLGPWPAISLGVLGVGIVAYPTWITESPPVALALPLAFAIYALAHERLRLGAIAAAVVVLGLAFALTKGFGVASVAAATPFALVRQRRELALRRAVVYASGPLAVAAAGAVLFVVTSGWMTHVLGLKFLPADAVDGVRMQFDHRDTHAVAPAFQVIAELFLVWALARARAWATVAILCVGVAGNWLVSGHGFDIAVAIGVVAAVMFFASRGDALRTQLPLVLAAGITFALASTTREVYGVRAGAVLSLLLAGGVLAALAPGRTTAAAAAVVAAAVGAGVTAGRAEIGLADAAVTLPRSEYAVWHEVWKRVPTNALIFTSLTGPIVAGNQGWNYYPGITRRQVYLAGWSSSPLLVDDAEREQRLALNEAVLSGEVTAASVPLSRRYGRYYAVVRRRQPVPNASRIVYANDAFTLYEIP